MTLRYELATLGFPLLHAGEVANAARDWVEAPGAEGTWLGSFRAENGTLGRLYVLRGFDTPEQLARERERALMSASPFNAGAHLQLLEMDSYAPFAFLPPARIDPADQIYELRTYRLKPGGLPPTLAGWQAAIAPAKAYTDHLVINMYALDGPPRITHLWGFASIAQRFALREQVYAQNLWPPKDGPENIVEATSTIALPQMSGGRD